MPNLIKPLLAVLFVMSLAACATTPPVDIQPPPKKPLDAKSTLENGKK